MGSLETIIIMLLITCLLAMVAKRANVPFSTMVLLGGVALGSVPGISGLQIAPEAMLMIFLPPLLFEAAYFTSLRDFRRNLRSILQLAIGLVFITGLAVAWMFRYLVPDASWALGFVLGAIISPPDVVAATSVIKKMRVPKRISTILEGESLVNDAMGLVMYKFAVAAVLTSQFSFADASGQFLWLVASGVAIGLAVGVLFIRLFPYIRDLPIEILSTVVVAYLSYLLAEEVHGSGVLAVVTAGLYVGWHSPSMFTSRFRMPAEAVWHMLTFVFSAIVFILIGMQIPSLADRLSVYEPEFLAKSAALVCGTVVLIRFIYVFVVGYGTRWLFPSVRAQDLHLPWQNVFLIGYMGMRGVVSLATALAVPMVIMNGAPFPHRDFLLFLALSVIVFTLVVQGMALPWLLRRLTLTYDHKILHEEWYARVSAARRAMQKILELEASGKAHAPALMRIKSHYAERLESLGDGPNTPLHPTEVATTTEHPILQAENRIWQEVLSTERESLISLRRAFEIGDDVMHDIIREIDLLATRFEARPH